MKLARVLILACCLAMASPALAQEEGKAEEQEKGGFIQGVMDVLGSAAKESLDESMDEWLGKYKGQLGEVKLVQRRGNAVVLEVSYDNVKRSDGVQVQGEVLSRGFPLEGFSNTLTPIRGRRGRVQLTISRPPADDSGWGVAPVEIESDQIELFLVRENHPDRHFGNIVYDLQKTWTSSDAPEELASGEAEGIELAQGETLEGAASGGARKPYVRPGTVLVPVATAKAQPAKPAKPRMVAAAPLPVAVQSYDFYAQAGSAFWRSAAGKLPFPGAASDSRGFVRQINRGYLNPHTAAIKMLETHPQWTSGGWIAGLYPSVLLGKNIRFRAVAGFLKGADHSDGATFMVQVYENGRYHRVLRRTVSPKRYVELEGDLSPWAGKKVQIILRVNSGRSSGQDWAVWVKPRLEQG
jgi:hypothetical protein